MTVSNLVEKFESFFDHKCRSKNKRYLICRILRRMQASVEIGLSERGIKNAIMLALDSEVRVKSPREPKASSVVIAEVPFNWFRDMRFLPLVQYFIETS